MKMKGFVVAAVLVLIVSLAWLRLRHHKMDSKKATAITTWLRTVHLKPGMNANVKLPPNFSGLAADDSVDVMQNRNGKLAYFLKTSEGYKGNYQGYIYVDSGFPFTITKDSYDRNTIDIFNLGGNYPVIDKKISNHLYAVFFDLN